MVLKDGIGLCARRRKRGLMGVSAEAGRCLVVASVRVGLLGSTSRRLCVLMGEAAYLSGFYLLHVCAALYKIALYVVKCVGRYPYVFFRGRWATEPRWVSLQLQCAVHDFLGRIWPAT